MGFTLKQQSIKRQGRTSKSLLYKCAAIDRTVCSKSSKEIVRNRLAQEEAQMAAMQVRKVANTVDDRVKGIVDNHA